MKLILIDFQLIELIIKIIRDSSDRRYACGIRLNYNYYLCPEDEKMYVAISHSVIIFDLCGTLSNDKTDDKSIILLTTRS